MNLNITSYIFSYLLSYSIFIFLQLHIFKKITNKNVLYTYYCIYNNTTRTKVYSLSLINIITIGIESQIAPIAKINHNKYLPNKGITKIVIVTEI